MGSSYTKQKQESEYEKCREIPFGDGSNWIYGELLYEAFMQLIVRVDNLKQELILLKNNPHLTNPPPKPMADACCQTRDQSAMEIELAQASSPRRTVRCTSLKKKIFYTKVYTKKHVRRETMEVEKEKSTHHPKPKRKILKSPQKFVKIFVRKEIMEIETKNAHLKETPPKNVVNRKTRHKGTPKELAPIKRRKKRNTPNKVLGGSELKEIKILTQPAKVTLIADFFSALEKSQGCVKIKIAPDPT